MTIYAASDLVRNLASDSLDAAEVALVINRLEERCRVANTSFRVEQPSANSLCATVGFRNGETIREVRFYSAAHIKLLLESDFESAEFLGEYLSLWYPKRGEIEAGLFHLPGTRLARDYHAARKGSFFGHEARGFLSNGQPHEISIAAENRASAEFNLLCGKEFIFSTPVLRIRNLPTMNCHEALVLLRNIADATLFSADRAFGVPFVVPIMPRITMAPEEQAKEVELDLTFPSKQYDSNAMSLYFYGRAGRDVPLLSYLAFYQVLEYFFPPKTTTLRSERQQLRAVLEKHVDSEKVRQSYTMMGYDLFFEDGPPILTGVGIERYLRGVSLLHRVGDRVYDLRCRIVHTKGSIGKFLLPNSGGAALLSPDLHLIRFLAQELLDATATPYPRRGVVAERGQ